MWAPPSLPLLAGTVAASQVPLPYASAATARLGMLPTFVNVLVSVVAIVVLGFGEHRPPATSAMTHAPAPVPAPAAWVYGRPVVTLTRTKDWVTGPAFTMVTWVGA